MMRRSLFLCLLGSSSLILACGDDSPSGGGGNGGHPSTGGAGGSGAGMTSGGGGSGAGFANGGAGGGPCGPSCPDGSVCWAGTCCETPCGVAGQSEVCCGGQEICSFQQCVTPGSDCVDSTDCPDGSICDYSLGPPPAEGGGGAGGGGMMGTCGGGFSPQTGKCLPAPPECAPGQDPGDPITCLPSCEYKPPTQDFTPTLKFAWGGDVVLPSTTDVMMTPIVTQLDDDDCNGKVDGNDIPEIVFSTFSGGAYFKMGTLHAISIVDGAVVDKLTIPDSVQPGSTPASADIDGDGVPEIVACMNPGPNGASCCDALAQNTGVVAFRADGSVLWTQPDNTKVHCGYESPVIANVDADPDPEIIVGLTILDGKTGAVEKELDPAISWGVKLPGVVDLDGDGVLDITTGQRAWRSDGTVLWDLRTGPDAIPPGYHAVGDFDLDGVPEVVVISSSGPHTASLVRYDALSASGADVIRKGIDINNGTSTASFCGVASEYGGGPPTVADFDGDGVPDVGAAGAVGYVVMNGARLVDQAFTNSQVISWFKTTHDCSSAVTGSAVFDFNGDGRAEVVYSDEYHLWMYDGVSGDNLIPSTCNTTGTLWEYPVVADVDNDGQADIVVASNAYGITCPDNGSKQSGIRVFGSANNSWVRTRRIWNEHAYHVTNVAENGAVPVAEPPNWTTSGLNNYRQNRQPGSEFAAPDAVVSIAPQCTGDYALVATVRNLGSAALPAGLAVGFYAGALGSGVLLGSDVTTKILYPAEAENIVLSLVNPDQGILDGTTPIYAVVVDGVPPANLHECRTDNNTSVESSGACGIPQ
ncbi:MAG: VCBS repeat-containing protein [Polyangiaceae bacterium]